MTQPTHCAGCGLPIYRPFVTEPVCDCPTRIKPTPCDCAALRAENERLRELFYLHPMYERQARIIEGLEDRIQDLEKQAALGAKAYCELTDPSLTRMIKIGEAAVANHRGIVRAIEGQLEGEHRARLIELRYMIEALEDEND